MNARITFPPILSDDVSDEPLIIEAKLEGYMVRRVFVDQGAAVQVMFEHCFRNLCSTIQARLTQTHTELVGFSREQLLPMGKIELEVMFGSEGLSQRTTMRFTVVPASSPYNIILGRTGVRKLHAISSTTHAMMKFPTPRGISMLVPRRDAIFECRQLEILFGLSAPTDKFAKRQQGRVHLVTIRYGRYPKTNKSTLLEHESKYRPSATKAKGSRPKKSEAVIKEVKEWVKLGIVRPVRYSTWISNPVLVKKADGTWRVCIDFKNLNSACPEDYYPLPEIDLEIEAVMEFPFKCFLDAYKGEDLRQSEEGQHETKSKKILIQSEGRKVPQRESLLIPISQTSHVVFETLKNITKENRNDFHWTEATEQAFQELKKLIMELPMLTTLNPKEILYVYITTFREAILNKPEASGKLAKYAVELGAYNITYIPRNTVKGQVLADFLNEVPVRTKHLEICSLANDKKVGEWTLFIDGASSLKGAGVGLVLIDPTRTEYTYAIRLNFTRTNNEVEYKVLLAGLRIARKMKVSALKDNWMTPIIKCLDEGIWSKDENEARALQMKISQYVMEEGILFKKSYLAPMLRCVGSLQANYIIREVHEGACRMHAGARSMVAKIIRQGYYWPSIYWDTKEFVEKRFMPDTRFGTKTPEDKANIYHVAMDEIHYRCYTLLHQMDESKALRQDHRKGS
nr:reverse transcriptase domain-containing protein [Tanacetum cinerariifolium]